MSRSHCRPLVTRAATTRRRRGAVAALVALALGAAGCAATDDGTRVRDRDGAGVPLETGATP